jgi:hypothetical protein
VDECKPLVTGHQKLNYRGPFITAVLGGPTSGGTTTIYGRNFGPEGEGGNSTVQELFITGDNNVQEVCTDAAVVTENTQIECTTRPGSGTGKDVDITISGALASTGTSGHGLFNYAPAEVTSADPQLAQTDTQVTFDGTSFGTNVGLIKVYVDDIVCTPVTLVEDHGKISCPLPKSSGGLRPVRVDVDGITGNAKPVYNYPLPTITQIMATLPSKGALLTVYGANFGGTFDTLKGVNDTQSPQIVNVTVGSALCTTPKVIVEDGVITCDVPAALAIDYGGEFNLADWNHAAGGNMTIFIRLVGDQNSGTSGVDKFAFTQPTVTNIQPSVGKMGDVIVVTGSDLGDNLDAIQVYIDGRISTKIVINSAHDAFTFKVPVGTALDNQVVMKINGRNTTYSSVAPLFDYEIPFLDPAGTIPPSTTFGGVLTTLKGSGFGPVGNAYLTSVLIQGGVGLCTNPNVTVDDVELTCTVGKGQGGSINTTVTVDGLTSLVTPAFSFHVPIVNRVTTEQAGEVMAKGDTIFIYGRNFGNDPDFITVRIKGDLDKPGQGVVCPLTIGKLTQEGAEQMVTCKAPLMVGVNVSVIVDVAGLENINANMLNKVSYGNPVVYTASPVKTNGGEASGMVTITGSGFGPAGAMYSQYFTSVFLGTVPCNQPVVTITDSTVECSPSGGVGQNLDVVVTMNNAGSPKPQVCSTPVDSDACRFSYLPPTITSIEPPRTIGGAVTVYGENFGPADTAANATVYTEQTCSSGITASSFLGASGCEVVEGLGQATAVTVVDHETITFDFPPGVGGGFDLLIQVGGQNSGVSGDNKFAYHVPVVQLVVPAVQPATLQIEDTKITITGTNFGTDQSAVQVSVGGEYSPSSSIRLFNFRNDDDEGSVTGVSEIFVTVPFNAGREKVDGARQAITRNLSLVS